MIDDIKTLARSAFLPCTEQFDVSSVIDGDDMVRLNCEAVPPQLVFESGGSWTQRAATDAELQQILDWLAASPPHPAELTPLEIEARFSESELVANETHARTLARRLYLATGPVAWDVFTTGLEQLQQAGLLTAERVQQIKQGGN